MFSFLLAPQPPSSLPLDTHTYRKPFTVLPQFHSPSGYPAILVPPLFSLSWHSWTPNSPDLWIFPGSPLDLPFVSRTPVSGSFLTSLPLLLLFHLHLRTLASQSPLRHLILLLSLIPWITIDFFLTHLVSPWLIFAYPWFVIPLLPYSSCFTLTHHCWLIAPPCTI